MSGPRCRGAERAAAAGTVVAAVPHCARHRLIPLVTLTQLHTFLAVAETGSVRAAAERLVVTESAVSSCVAALQKDLELALVTKNGRGLRLTDAGSVYMGYVRKVLGLLDEGRSAAAGEAGGGVLRVAAVTTAGEQLLPGLLAGFRRRYPRIGIHLEVGNRERTLRLAGDHQVDLVLGGRPPQGPGWPRMVVHAVRPNELVVVGPGRALLRRHFWPGRRGCCGSRGRGRGRRPRRTWRSCRSRRARSRSGPTWPSASRWPRGSG